MGYGIALWIPVTVENFNSPAKEWPSKRHTLGSNILLADGHAEYHKMMDLGSSQA